MAQQNFPPLPFKYLKGQLLQAGLFGPQYLGMDTKTGEFIMCEEADKQATGSSKLDIAKLKELMDRKLKHPNLFEYVGVEETNDTIKIFGSYLPGGTMRNLVQNNGKLSEKLVVAFIKPVLLGMKVLSDHGVSYTVDLNNIWIDASGAIRLDYLNAAKAESAEKTSEPLDEKPLYKVAAGMAHGLSFLEKENDKAGEGTSLSNEDAPAGNSYLSTDALNFLHLVRFSESNNKLNLDELLEHPFLSSIDEDWQLVESEEYQELRGAQASVAESDPLDQPSQSKVERNVPNLQQPVSRLARDW
ncbi:hypothetical protein BT63DRAFT_167699 [Microthyrium microscopicum]|uniref:mitogen-activated protein kinase n=1 Tax=Microthyrium microscopicum TaxID=703497 RepID=A0A6A6UNH8_9PEZI|nr:hypothetical protein BT63DRAFT_167699 [Microthyrium microscopicum]